VDAEQGREAEPDADAHLGEVDLAEGAEVFEPVAERVGVEQGAGRQPEAVLDEDEDGEQEDDDVEDRRDEAAREAAGEPEERPGREAERHGEGEVGEERGER